jgi:hypothetical protein
MKGLDSLRSGLARVALASVAVLLSITAAPFYGQAAGLPVGVPQQSAAGVLPHQAKSVAPPEVPSRPGPALWSEPLRGSWVREGALVSGDVVLADGNRGCEIVVADNEHTAVKQAAAFLASDIEKISGYKPSITLNPTGNSVIVRLLTVGNANTPAGILREKLEGQWEAYQILTTENSVWLVGSNFRGTAFAAYTLSERLGIDPLYHWTGYTPARHRTLILKKTNYYVPPPTFKYRGLFHDDEDILPRPFDENGYPLRTGAVPRVWYERFFETALRLRLNQVAPYVRVQRRFEIQKLASDWGLFYTSHHYDTLLSNPYGFERFGLAKARNAGDTWDWFANKAGLINFWRGGVLENRELDCIWPVGMRGTEDFAYKFPPDLSEEEKSKIFREAIDTQVKLVKDLLPSDKQPLFHFTLYGEMLERYRAGKFDLPADVIVVWTDDGDGRMRALPEQLGKWKHGVYYHLAFLGRTTKQTTHTVAPDRIAEEFRRIVDSGATEYVLVNVSELREFVMETRMIADLTWDAPAAWGMGETPNRFVEWWCREYFGDAAAKDAAQVYHRYYQILDGYDKLWYGSEEVREILKSLLGKLAGRPFSPVPPELLRDLQQRRDAYRAVMDFIDRAERDMTRPQQQYFYENAVLGLLLDQRPTEAAIKLAQALEEKDLEKTWALCFEAREPLERLEVEILRAERPPFEGWYRETWIRTSESPFNVHRPYEQVRAFLSSGGKSFPGEDVGERRRSGPSR